jgi:organic hydroperoxide reductase OsmC/OhrA
METLQEFQVDLNWQENQKAIVSAVIFNDTIEVSSSPCFKKSDGAAWSAEHLFIASVASSYMTGFFRAAKNKGLTFKNYTSTARASILISDEFSEITDIVIKPVVVITEKNKINRVLKILTICRDHSLVLKALKVRLHVFPSVIIS